MHDIIEQLETRRTEARAGGGERRVAAQHSKGKLTARERIEVLGLGDCVVTTGRVPHDEVQRYYGLVDVFVAHGAIPESVL